uniref:uncharacterized protein LOC120347218 n=1 Tax=Styela clava TaxID=7725 RepID=UPI00193A8924|nr:uncharacterized protein LOC120347218 [Styela clava]
MTTRMELLKTLPGVTVRKHEVQYPHHYNNVPSNVTVLNVLRPFSQQRVGSLHANVSPRLVYSAGDSYIMNFGGDPMLRGDSIFYPRKPDPKPILKNQNANNSPYGSRVLFLEHNAANVKREGAKSPGITRKSQKHGTVNNVLNQSEQHVIPKTPSKNVTFKLENEDRRRNVVEAQWSLGISKINKPLREPRKIHSEQYRSNEPRRALTSEQSSRKYFLPLLLKRNTKGNHIVPATATPSPRRPQGVGGFNDRGPLRFRSMADEYRNTLNQPGVNKRGLQRPNVSA